MLAKARAKLKQILYQFGYHVEKIQKDYPVILRPVDPMGVEILADSEFQLSCHEIAGLTLLDVPRLANLWQLCQLSNPRGGIIEVGAYKGGGALHLSNSCPNRKVYVCDSFEGFSAVDPNLDSSFDMSMFKDTLEETVRQLFINKGRDAQVIKGYFPESCQGVNLAPLSFAHVDVDVYQSTIDTLLFLDNFMIEKSLIVLDDYKRRADGVNQAIGEFLALKKNWQLLPMFPSQAVLVHSSWFDRT